MKDLDFRSRLFQHLLRLRERIVQLIKLGFNSHHSFLIRGGSIASRLG
jgi:hypothetical protein